MSTYQAFEVTGSRQFAWTTRELVPPRAGHVRIKVESCGVCHSDVLAVEGLRADPSQPVVPGHEVVGTIDAVGEGVRAWQVGERVGVGFLAGHCGECDPCRRGDFVNCADQEQTGTTVDGGYAEVLYARSNALARIPEGISSAEAAPLLCAGLTSLSALRQLDSRPGSLVAVQGIGGLGHLAVQYAARLGHRVVAIARGAEKASLAASLGADDYIDSAAEHPGEALARLGGADGIVATAASGSSMTPLVTGLAPRGRMIVVGVGTDPISVSTPDLVLSTRTITGSLTGTPIENEDNLAFSVRHGVLPLIERKPLAEAPKAYERMMSGEARFRVVLDAVRA
ncbi:alcohol dehydrogenase catalytic domain-containing protein [Streptomyces sp. NPDC002769]|uniref:alcohol dehydrogenase catalytic domain-containing protein n=1 Tax=Streptomyces sp. NPDC002769 TaxID=3154542 RepID=UPI003329DFCF